MKIEIPSQQDKQWDEISAKCMHVALHDVKHVRSIASGRLITYNGSEKQR